MSINKTENDKPASELSSLIDPFIRRDYTTCAERAQVALSGSYTHEAAQFLLVSLERLARLVEAREQGQRLIRSSDDLWERELLKLTLGDATSEEILAMIPSTRTEKEARQLWQVNCYLGMFLMTLHQPKEANQVFKNIMASGVPPVSCLELYLMGIENNFLVTGDSGTDVDKPAVELNLQTSQLYGQKRYEAARGVATRAYELARRTLGPQHPAYIVAVHNLGAINAVLGNSSQAEAFLAHVVELRLAAYGEDDPGLKEARRMLDLVRTNRDHR